jgi:hypothetical protein
MSDISESEAKALLVELEELERDERRLSAARRKLHERIDNGFPNEFTLRQERQVSDDRRALHLRIDALHARLLSSGLDLRRTA